MHIISSELLDDILRVLDEAEENWLALIIWQTEPPFSAGANLLQLMQGVQEVGEEQSGGFLASLKARCSASNIPWRAVVG